MQLVDAREVLSYRPLFLDKSFVDINVNPRGFKIQMHDSFSSLEREFSWDVNVLNLVDYFSLIIGWKKPYGSRLSVPIKIKRIQYK